MPRTLRFIGIALLAGLAWVLLADTAGWVPSGSVDVWVRPLASSAIAFLSLGILFGALAPVFRRMSQTRCCRCGSPIERGQTFCADHLQQSVNEYRDQFREGGPYPRGGPV